MRSEGGFFAFENARVCCSKSPAAAAARRDWRRGESERECESARREARSRGSEADCVEPIDIRVSGPKTAAISHSLSVASIPAIRRKAEKGKGAFFLIAPEERAALDAVTLRMPVCLPVCLPGWLAATLPDSTVHRPPGPSEETRAKLAAQTRHNPEAPHSSLHWDLPRRVKH